MKKKLHFLFSVLALMLFAATANAQSVKPVPKASPLAEDGNTVQYLYNVEAGAFLLGANNWGTRASVDPTKGWQIKASKSGDAWKLNCYPEAGDNKNTWRCVAAPGGAEDIWADQPTTANNSDWTITPLENNQFKISIASIDGYLAVVPSKADTRLYLSAESEAKDVWIAVSEKDYKEYALWDGQTGTYGGISGAVERYATAPISAGNVLTQTFTDLENGTYTVTFKVAGSFANNGDATGNSGDYLSVAFAQNKAKSFPVVDKRTSLTEADMVTVSFKVYVEDGTLTYGIRNNAPGGNWYVAKTGSIIYEGELPQVDDDADTQTVEAELVHTASASWSSNSGRANTIDSEKEYYNLEVGNGWGGAAFAEFNMKGLENVTISKVTLDWMALNGNNNADRDNIIYGLNAGRTVDYDDIKENKNAHLYNGKGDKTEITTIKGKGTYDEETDVTEFVKEILASGQSYVIFQWTGNGGGAELYGKASENAPKLIIEYAAGVPALANPAFDVNEEDIITVNTFTYKSDADKPENAGSVSGCQTVTGWTSTNGLKDGATGGVFAYGSSNLLNSQKVPAEGPDGNEDGVALGLVGAWSAPAQYITDDEITLSAGEYTFTFNVYNSANEGVVWKNVFGFIADDSEYFATQTTFKAGEWQEISVTFTLYEETTGHISVGYAASGSGSGSNPHLFVDNVTIVKLQGIESLLAKLAEAIKAAQGVADGYLVGDGIFQYPESEMQPLYDAIAAAQDVYDTAEGVEDREKVQAAIDALNEAVENFAPVPNVPDPAQPYAFTLKTSKGTWTLSMENGIKVVHSQSEMFCDAVLYTGTPIYLVPQANGTFVLANRPGNASVYDFVNYEGSNNWTLKASTSDVTTPYGWTITALPSGGYTITGKNGFLGTNTSDGNDVQSPCYGDKKDSNGNYIWSITPIPSVEPLYADTPLTKEMFQVWDGTDAKAAPTGDEPTWDAPAFGIKCAEGETLYGNAAVDSLEYADITGARTLRIVGTPGLVTRVMLNARKVVHKVDDVVPAGAKIGYEVDGDTVVKAYIELNPTIAPNGVVDIDLTPYAYVHLNAINVQVGSAGAVYDLVLDPTTVVPEVVSIDLTQEMFKTWDGFDASANVVGNYPYWDAAELGTNVGAGATVYGSGNVTNTDYADISAADVLRVVGTPGIQLRVLLNRQADNSLVELNPTIGDEGYADVDLTSYDYAHLNAIKLGWGSPAGVIEALTLLINNEPALPNNVYEGYIAARVSHPAAGELAKKTDTQTVIIADVVDGMTSITFSNIDVAPMVFSELTIDNVAVTENADGSVSYSCKDVTITRQNGMMTTNYNASLTGTKASADATPVLTLTVAQGQGMELTVVFAATKEEAEAPLAGLVQGVDSIGTDAVKSNGKYLENGKIVIIRNGVKYNVNGTVVK